MNEYHQCLLARGGYGPDPVATFLVLAAFLLVGGVVVAVGKSANPKSGKYTNHQAGKETADNLVMGAAVIGFLGVLIYLFVKVVVWLLSLAST